MPALAYNASGDPIMFRTWDYFTTANYTSTKNEEAAKVPVAYFRDLAAKEQKGMVFAGEDVPDTIYKKGEGILLADGKPLVEVKFPIIKDIDDWKRHILEILRSMPP